MTVASAPERLNGIKHRIKTESIQYDRPMSGEQALPCTRTRTDRVSDPALDSVRLWMERCQSIEKPLILCISLLEAEFKLDWMNWLGWAELSSRLGFRWEKQNNISVIDVRLNFSDLMEPF